MNSLILKQIQMSFAKAIGRLLSPLTLFVWLSISVATALAGPFGSFETRPLSERIIFWGSLIAIAITIGYVLRVVIRGVCPLRPIFADLVFLGATTLITSLVLNWYVGIWTYDLVELRPSFLELMSYVFLCTLIVIFSRLLLPGYDYSSEEMPEPAAPQVHAEPGPVYESPRLHRRTDLPEDAKLLRLSAKDHMVTVVTTQGERSLRMRFGDAIDEADPVEGLCTHRSHWVAYDAVSHCHEVDGKPQLVLVNGDAIPVSRKYRNALMDAGLLKR